MKKYTLETNYTQTDRVRYSIIAETKEEAMEKAKKLQFDGSPEVVDKFVSVDIDLKNAVLYEVEEKLTLVQGGDVQ